MKILYGVPSEGMGHATRTKVIVTHLLKNHDVQIVTSDRAFTYLNNIFPNRVHQIEGFHLAYKNAVVSIGKTIFNTLKTAPQNLFNNLKQYFNSIKDFDPDLVISDFESFSFLYAHAHHKPLISIDNMQVINRTILGIDIPKEETKNHTIAKAVIKSKVPFANHYFISTFFETEIRKPKTSFVPPIIRQEILDAKPYKQDHIIVYQTSTSAKDLIENLSQLPNQHFIVYGLNKEETINNVQLKKFSEQGFISDLSSAKAVLANGGYSFISEAIYLKKPIFSVPIRNQFEQFVNASYIDKLKYGKHADEFEPDEIKAFIKNLNDYQINLEKYKQIGNEDLFNAIDNYLAKYI